MSTLTKSWLPKAAMIWCDMERGLYDWGGKKAPRTKDGAFRVMKSRILQDCGLAPSYRDANRLIWRSEAFQKALTLENRRRDHGIMEMVDEIEKLSGPLIELRSTIQENIVTVFERPPDAEDPLALAPKDYVSKGLLWCRYLDELTGRTESQKTQGIEQVLGALAKNQQVTSAMTDQALEIVKEYRKLQDRKLEHAGMLLEGELG